MLLPGKLGESWAQAQTSWNILKSLLAQLPEGVKMGTTTFEWAGVEKYSKELTIEHGLEGAPRAVLITPIQFALTAEWHTGTPTTFKARLFETQGIPAAGTKISASWVAFL